MYETNTFNLCSTRVKISTKSMLQEFHPCTLNYIQNVCFGRCCESSMGLSVVIHPLDNIDLISDKLQGIGYIKNNHIYPNIGNVCPFKNNKTHTCNIHENKPMGCRFSPFTLTKSGTLIVRNRYRLLKCYCKEKDGKLPAYKSHAWSLIQIFGEPVYRSICENIETGKGDFYVSITKTNLSILIGNTKIRNEKRITK